MLSIFPGFVFRNCPLLKGISSIPRGNKIANVTYREKRIYREEIQRASYGLRYPMPKSFNGAAALEEPRTFDSLPSNYCVRIGRVDLRFERGRLKV